jgi:hypothetical protein
MRVALGSRCAPIFYAQLMELALWIDLDGQLSRLDVSPPARRPAANRHRGTSAGARRVFRAGARRTTAPRCGDEPGALPLLQHTLLELWHQRTRGLLRLAEYVAMSDGAQTGLAVTVARRVNGALNDLSPGRREIARRVLLRLVQFGDAAAATRRQHARAALATAGDAPTEIDTVVRHLADRRLVTTSGGDEWDPSARIDLSHEVLLSAWPALGEWIRTREEDEQRRRVLEAKAAEWVKSGRGQSRLLDADELREVRSWLHDEKARDLGVSEEIQSLIVRSEGRRRRERRWKTIAILGLIGALVVMSTLAVIAGQRSREQGRAGAGAGEVHLAKPSGSRPGESIYRKAPTI